MKNEDQRNFILFAILAALLLFGWPAITGYFFPTKTPAANPPVTQIANGKETPLPAPGAQSPETQRDRAAVLAEAPRVRIETPLLKGSINLKGPRIDDLVLTQYKETVAKDSAPIRLLSPSGAAGAYFAGFGWRDAGLKAPGPDTVWRASGEVLTPSTPITLEADNGQGQYFRIELAVDDGYMFTVKQTVANKGSAPIQVAPYAYVNRVGRSPDVDQWIAHVGPMAVRDGSAAYVNWSEVEQAAQTFETTGGWAGFTDHYWLTAVIPDQTKPVQIQLRSGPNQSYQADYAVRNAQTVPVGQQVSTISRLFAGAKEVNRLDRYEDTLGIAKFGKAIDWGWFEVLEKPIFKYLDWLFRLVGNFGLAIILLTFTIRLLLFPIAQRQFASMASMRALQPKMKALQERYKDDKQRQQQEILKLYKEEKVNPLAGCLPTFIQIPIMFSLYKALVLTIEMRHQPFVLWIRDLSVHDPLTPVNLFGLLPFTPPAFLAIGVVPILLGISMYFQFKLNPAPMDETQKQVFSIMPWMMMFMMAPFAVGVQIYWITSNFLTIAQQWFLYRRHPQMKQAVQK